MATNSFDLGPYFCDNPHHALLHHVLDKWVGEGICLEFGVGEGHSLRCIARYMPVIGFDSFEGLPEDWRPGFDAGMFACDPPMNRPANTALVIGRFEDTLPKWDWDDGSRVALMHFDADLYSSTKIALEYVGAKLLPGTCVIFDEYWNYPEADQGERLAWKEYAEHFDIQWKVLGHGVQQWAIQIV